jgi:hypothetical protein
VENWANLDGGSKLSDAQTAAQLDCDAAGKTRCPDAFVTDTPNKGSPPVSVEFAAPDGSSQSVNVRVNGGSYSMGKLKLQNNMKIMLDVEGVSMNLLSKTNGAKAYFIAGQDTSHATCSLGCHTNFFEYLGRGGADGAADVNLDEFVGEGVVFDESSAVVPATETPCNTDTVVIPKRYGVNLLALGFHPFKELVYPASEERLVTLEAEEDVPDYMFFPTSRKKVFLGPDSMDHCSDHGLLADDKCICISECPAPGSELTESNKLRDAAKAFAQREIKAYNSKGARERFSYTFVNAFSPQEVDSNCRVDDQAVADLVAEYTGNHLSSLGIQAEIDTASATISATGILSGRAGDFYNQALLPKVDIQSCPRSPSRALVTRASRPTLRTRT